MHFVTFAVAFFLELPPKRDLRIERGLELALLPPAELPDDVLVNRLSIQ